MSSNKDRRRLPRKVGHGLAVVIGGKAHTVLDISTDGVAFQANGRHREGIVLDATLARLTDITDCIEAKITVVSSEETVIRGMFKPTVPLLRYVIGHIGEATGTEPAYFRK